MKIELGITEKDVEAIETIEDILLGGLDEIKDGTKDEWLDMCDIVIKISYAIKNQREIDKASSGSPAFPVATHPKTQKQGRLATLWKEIDRVLEEVINDPKMTPICHKRIRNILMKRIKEKFRFLDATKG